MPSISKRAGRAACLAAAAIVVFLSSTPAVAVELPFTTDLRLWLKADAGVTMDGSNRVSQWDDQLLGDNAIAENATQGSTGNMPVWTDGVLNGLPVLRFDNSDHLNGQGGLVLSGGGTAARTVVIVASSNNSNNTQIFDLATGGPATRPLYRITPEMGMRNGAGNRIWAGDPVGATPLVLAVQTPASPTSGTTEAFQNSATPLSPTATATPTGAMDTGTNGYQTGAANFNGDIAEILVYERVLDAAELNKVGSYLAGKYGIAASFTGEEIYWDNGSTDTSGAVDPPYPGDNLWSTASNWRANNSDPMNQFPNDTLPGPTDRVNISLHNVPAEPAGDTVPANVEAGDDILVNSVRVGGNFGLGVGGDGILNVNGGTLTIADNGGVGTGGRLEIGGTGNRSGTLNMNGGTLNVGLDIITGTNIGTGTSTINYEGGTLAAGDTDITVDNFNINPTDPGGNLTYTRSGGTLTVNNNLQLGGETDTGSNERGNLTQNGGDVTVGGDLIFGGAAGKEGGTYDLNAGTLTVSGDIVETTANVDAAQLHLNGGTLVMPNGGSGSTITVQRFSVGEAGGSNVTYSPDAPITTTGTFAVGGSGTGTFTLGGGSVTAGNMIVAQNPTGVGVANFDSGTFNTSSYVSVGYKGNGTLNVSGGTSSIGSLLLGSENHANSHGEVNVALTGAADSFTVTGTTYVGDDRVGELNITDATGTVSFKNLYIGQINNANSDGTVTIDLANDAQVVTANTVLVGNNGKGTLNLLEGTLTATGGFRLAETANAAGARAASVVIGSATTSPTLNVSGGNFETANNGTGSVVMHSGTLNQLTSNIIVGQSTGSDATFTLNDGLIDAENYLRVANNGTGVFVQNGGTVNVGTILDIGNSPNGDGTYTMNGGVLNVGDRVNSDLIIGNNNSVNSSALMEIIDGTVNVSKSIRIADSGTDSSGTLIVGDGTTNPTVNLNTAAGGNFESADNGTGTFTFKSGTVVMNDSNFITGQGVGSESNVTVGGFATAALLDLTGGPRDWNTNGGHGIVSVNTNGEIRVGRNINLSNNTDADAGLELTLGGGTVRVGANGSDPGNIDYRNNGPRDQINLQDGVLRSGGGTIFLRDADTSQFSMTGGRLENFATFNGTFTQDGGTVAPGSSPGTMTITGDYNLNAGLLEIEIESLSSFDLVNVTGNADLQGGVSVLLPGSYTPQTGDYFDVLVANSLTLSPDFAVVQPPGGLSPANYFTASVVGGNTLRLFLEVPEPSSVLLLALGGLLLGLPARRRRWRK